MNPFGGVSVMKMENIFENYKHDAGLFEDIENLSQFGRVNAITGEFEFFLCSGCKGPKLGHKDREEVCKRKIDKEEKNEMDDEVVEEVKMKLATIHKEYFEMNVAMLDKRRSKVVCDGCDFEAKDRYELECHARKEHGLENKSFNSNSGKIELKIPGIQEVLSKLSDNLSREERKVNHVTKSKPPPLWVSQTYERYEKAI